MNRSTTDGGPLDARRGNATIALSTEQYEKQHKRRPVGIRDWCFRFDGYYVDGSRLAQALRDHNARFPNACKATITVRAWCVIEIADCEYDEARQHAVRLAKLSVRESVTGLRAEVLP